MISLEGIQTVLADHQPELSQATDGKHASVALILRNGSQGPEVLFIRRAEHEGDPWSGDVAFPGGRVEKKDENPRKAAERETLEEIGLDLEKAAFLGQIDDIQGAYLPVRISCYAYCLNETPQLKHNYEVVNSFWIPISTLQAPERNRTARFTYRNHTKSHPIIDLDGFSERFLWGITYRLLQQFLELVTPE